MENPRYSSKKKQIGGHSGRRTRRSRVYFAILPFLDIPIFRLELTGADKMEAIAGALAWKGSTSRGMATPGSLANTGLRGQFNNFHLTFVLTDDRPAPEAGQFGKEYGNRPWLYA